MMKRYLVFIVLAAMVLTMCACGKKEEPAVMAGMPNPLHECTKDELAEKTGVALDAPAGASDVSYSYIEGSGAPVSQVIFQLDGKKFCYRAQPTSYTSIEANINENELVPDLAKALNDCTNIGAALSGMHYEWKSVCLLDVAGSRDAVCAFNEGKAGFISWLDVVPGILYSLSIDKGANQDLLMNTAEICFVPTQGDVG